MSAPTPPEPISRELQRLEIALYEASMKAPELRFALTELVAYEVTWTRSKIDRRDVDERTADYYRGYLAAILKLKTRLTEETKKWPTQK